MTAQVLSLFPQISPAEKPRKIKCKPKYTPEFELFWKGYPPRFNSSKADAFTAWQKLDEDDQAHAMKVLPTFVSWARRQEERHIPHAATWLNGRRFETITVVQPHTRINPASVDWASVMKLYYMTSNWKQEYGPAPGHPNCRVPKEYLGDMS